MKKITKVYIAVLFSLAVHFSCYSQSTCFPTNVGTGNIEIKGKVAMAGKSKDEIFNKVVIWGTSKTTSGYKKNDNNVRQELKDKDAGVYKFFTQITYKYKDGLRTVYFAITTQVTAGGFEYIVNDFIMNNKPMELYLMDKEGDEFYKVSFEDICKKMTFLLDDLKALK